MKYMYMKFQNIIFLFIYVILNWLILHLIFLLFCQTWYIMLHTILIKFIYISKRKIFLDVYYIIKNLNLYKIKNIMVRFGEVDAI